MEYPIRISLISYTNTKPFVFGLLNSQRLIGKIETSFDSPAECAGKLWTREADLGIVPIAALSQIPHYSIISDYCIGADGPVNSVFVFSNDPIQEIETIVLDYQSRTSNNLTRILCDQLWKIRPEFIYPYPFHEIFPEKKEDVKVENGEDKKRFTLKEGEKGGKEIQQKKTAYVLIGDRTFQGRKTYKYHYDLSGEWKKLTGLPFVFAVWAATRELNEEFQLNFNEALKFGLDSRGKVLEGIRRDPNHDPELDYADYLFNKLSFDFNDKKKEAMDLYLRTLRVLDENQV